MNIYDTRIIICSKCKKGIGEIEFDSSISSPICGICLSKLKELQSILCTNSSIGSSIDIISTA